MTVGLLMTPLLLLVLVSCKWLEVKSASSETQLPDHRVFLWRILDKYGQNGSIPLEGFERLYKHLGLGKTFLDDLAEFEHTTSSSSSETSLSRKLRDAKHYNATAQNIVYKPLEELDKLVLQHNETSPARVSGLHLTSSCLSVQEVLAVYGLPPGETLGPVSFLHLCPAIVYQLDQGTCIPGERKPHSDASAATSASWFFAGLSWLVISVSGMIIVTLVPLLQKTLLNQLIGFLVALAVGTLLGDAFLHLVPHALMESHDQGKEESGHDHTSSVRKTGLMFLTVVFFFAFESVLNAIRFKKDEKKVSDAMNYISVSVNENEREMMEVNKAPESEEIHAHGHSHGTGTRSNTALMVIMGDGLHNLTDGLAIGAAFSGGLAPGFATAVAVFTHELPHELGDFAVLLQSGVTVRKALLFNMLSSALSLLGTVIGLVIGNFGDTTKYVYAITAGCFTYIALSNLVPEMNKQNSGLQLVVLRVCGVLCGGLLMACIAVYENDLQSLFS